MATGILRLESRRSNPYSTCHRSHFNNYLAAETSFQTLLAVPDYNRALSRRGKLQFVGKNLPGATYILKQNIDICKSSVEAGVLIKVVLF